MSHPLDNIPPHIASQIRQLWSAEVAGGRKRYEATGSVIGRTAQWKISRLLKENGIKPKTDGRWEAVRNHGRDLYYDHAKP